MVALAGALRTGFRTLERLDVRGCFVGVSHRGRGTQQPFCTLLIAQSDGADVRRAWGRQPRRCARAGDDARGRARALSLRVGQVLTSVSCTAARRTAWAARARACATRW
jgi:hypothetical protein